MKANNFLNITLGKHKTKQSLRGFCKNFQAKPSNFLRICFEMLFEKACKSVTAVRPYIF